MTTLLLTPMILIPFLGALLQVLSSRPARGIAIAAGGLSSVLGLMVLSRGWMGVPDALVERLPWVGSYAISYEMAVDGISRIAVLIVSLLFPLLIASEWTRERGARGLHALLLVLQGSLLGAVCAQDLFLLFFFWAISSVPVFFLVGIWGGPRREEAAFRTLVTSAFGSALLFGAIILVYHAKEPHTFLLRDLVEGGIPARILSLSGIELSSSLVAFILISVSFALRAPIWPLHGWFARLVDEAPPAVTVAVAGAVVPCAIQIYLRLTHLLFPELSADWADAILAIGLVNLVVGALVALSRRRLSSLLSSLMLGQVGISLIAIGSRNPTAMAGMAHYQLASAVAIAALVLLLGFLGARGLTDRLSGANSSGGALALSAPFAGAVMALALAAWVGAPGLGGFVGESLVFMGAFSRSAWILVPILAAILLLAVRLSGIYREIFLGGEGAVGEAGPEGMEVVGRERAILIPLVALMLVFGLYPKPLLDLIRPAASHLLAGEIPAFAPPMADESAPVPAPQNESPENTQEKAPEKAPEKEAP